MTMKNDGSYDELFRKLMNTLNSDIEGTSAAVDSEDDNTPPPASVPSEEPEPLPEWSIYSTPESRDWGTQTSKSWFRATETAVRETTDADSSPSGEDESGSYEEIKPLPMYTPERRSPRRRPEETSSWRPASSDDVSRPEEASSDKAAARRNVYRGKVRRLEYLGKEDLPSRSSRWFHALFKGVPYTSTDHRAHFYVTNEDYEVPVSAEGRIAALTDGVEVEITGKQNNQGVIEARRIIRIDGRSGERTLIRDEHQVSAGAIRLSVLAVLALLLFAGTAIFPSVGAAAVDGGVPPILLDIVSVVLIGVILYFYFRPRQR